MRAAGPLISLYLPTFLLHMLITNIGTNGEPVCEKFIINHRGEYYDPTIDIHRTLGDLVIRSTLRHPPSTLSKLDTRHIGFAPLAL